MTLTEKQDKVYKAYGNFKDELEKIERQIKYTGVEIPQTFYDALKELEQACIYDPDMYV